ncbi:MAG: low specificity L-threonine aldolase [Flavobacteriaceae bacterium]
MPDFASDNAHPASARIMQAIVDANQGAVPSYGADPWSRKAEAMLAETFERECSALLVATGTAANALALASLTPVWGAVVCHQEAHIATDECGAPEFYSGGAQLIRLPGDGAKIAAGDLERLLAGWDFGVVHHVQPAALSLSQLTECGQAYSLDEIAALSEVAHRHGLKVHMDGARFANAMVGLEASAAEMSWKAGVDIVSFGGTKNGCLAVEAIVAFDTGLRQELEYRRKRSGHLFSKGRLLGAQMTAYLEDGHWIGLATHANSMARRLAEGLVATGRARLAWPVAGNEVFAILRRTDHEALLKEGVRHYDWPGRPAGGGVADEEAVGRFVVSHTIREEDVDAACAALRNQSA